MLEATSAVSLKGLRNPGFITVSGRLSGYVYYASYRLLWYAEFVGCSLSRGMKILAFVLHA